MNNPKPLDYLLLGALSLIWASAFFNIKIATYSFGPVTIAFFRIFLGAIPVVLLCFAKRIKIEAFSKDWLWFASIGFINLVIPFENYPIILYHFSILKHYILIYSNHLLFQFFVLNLLTDQIF